MRMEIPEATPKKKSGRELASRPNVGKPVTAADNLGDILTYMLTG